MKQIIGLVFALLLIASPVLALDINSHDKITNNYGDTITNNTPTANAVGIGVGVGVGVSKVDNKNTNTNKNDNTNLNFNDNSNKNIVSQGQLQGQMQGQMQGQGQINEGNTVTITNEKQYLGVNAGSAPEVNFGSGKVNWGFSAVVFDIPVYVVGKEKIKSLIMEKHNVKGDDLIAAILKMQKKEGTITYNTRILIVEKEAQKSYSISIIGAPAGSGIAGTTGVAAAGSIGPSFAGTKANNLYSIYLVKVL